MLTGGRTVELIPASVPGAPLVLLNGQAGEGKRVAEAVRRSSNVDFSLAVVEDLDWDSELTPWPAPAAFRGGKPYAGRADVYLRELTDDVLPRLFRALAERPVYAMLAGYSLAGLFALYAPFRTSAFARICSVSGSAWYPGFVDYVRQTRLTGRPDCVYLSLGDREAKTKNPALNRVERDTRSLAEFFSGQGVHTVMEMNLGGHFDHPEQRMARGIARLLEEREPRG